MDEKTENNNDNRVLEFNFTQEQYLSIKRRQTQLRFMSFGIMGAVIPFFVSVFVATPDFALDEEIIRGINGYHILTLLLMGLSFIFGVLGLNYGNLSKQHDQMVGLIKRVKPSFEREDFFFENRPEGYYDLTWPFCHAVIFVAPSIFTMMASTHFFYSTNGWPFPFYVIWALLVSITLIALFAIAVDWSARLEQKHNLPTWFSAVVKMKRFPASFGVIAVLFIITIVWLPQIRGLIFPHREEWIVGKAPVLCECQPSHAPSLASMAYRASLLQPRV